MSTGENSKVPYTVANIMKCMCPKCPVQADSTCVKGKLENLTTELENVREGAAPEPQKFQEYIVRQVKPLARTLIQKNNAFAIPVLSG